MSKRPSPRAQVSSSNFDFFFFSSAIKIGVVELKRMSTFRLRSRVYSSLLLHCSKDQICYNYSMSQFIPKHIPVLIGFMLFFLVTEAQDLSGTWQGILLQNDSKDTFHYEVNLQQNEDGLQGTSTSYTLDKTSQASFSFTGIINQNDLVIQEIEQTNPESPKWCLKYMNLQLSIENGIAKLMGTWKADKCLPGKVILYNDEIQLSSFIEENTTNQLLGKWTGYLSQSDRNYGFYFELNLSDDTIGESYIVSEGNGGDAFHHFNWTYQPDISKLIIQESYVKKKSVRKWPWCIKSLNLQMKKTPHSYTLEGEWQGYIEGKDPQTGACAPGTIFLEKPVATPPNTVIGGSPKVEETQYINDRKVKVQRIIEVKSPNLKIKVWDNGTVDGDIVTVFLNGKLLFKDYRVTKHKYTKLVKLEKDNNYLVLHAEDLGDISPNTVAVSIDDGEREQIIILSSNLAESGAVMIKQFKLE